MKLKGQNLGMTQRRKEANTEETTTYSKGERNLYCRALRRRGSKIKGKIPVRDLSWPRNRKQGTRGGGPKGTTYSYATRLQPVHDAKGNLEAYRTLLERKGGGIGEDIRVAVYQESRKTSKILSNRRTNLGRVYFASTSE